MKRVVRAVDLFCGAGGTSTGLALACEAIGARADLLAINHWPIAIRSHEANHPWARHLCKSLHEVDPRKIIPGRRLDLLVASPECTHHSIARGGRPVTDQMRASAWQIVDWLAALRVDSLLLENVREFRDWGPIGATGRPIKSRRGETYRAFVAAIRSLGYSVEDRILNAADYGDPTTRERLFIVARRGRRPLRWPQPSHHPTGLLGQRWRPAREIIDWSIEGRSIFGRKRPLSPNTLARIAAGLRKFGGVSFVLPPLGYYHRNGRANRPRSIEAPVQTITSRGGGHLVEPFLLSLRGTAPAQLARSAHSLDAPAPTATANGNHLGVVEPFILPHRMFDGMQVDSIERPLRTIRAVAANVALVQPFIVHVNHGDNPRGSGRGNGFRGRSTQDPLPTVTSGGRGMALVQPFLVPFYGERAGQAPRTHDVDAPVPTIPASPKFGLVEPFLVKYNRTGGARSVDEPLDTLTAKDRFALVEVDGQPMALDVRFRMLQPHELARAMGFPDGYTFAGNREEQVRQIGNAVAVNLAVALCRALLE